MGIHILICIIVFAFGACFGSFLNVCIYRIPEKKSIVTPSKCSSCGRKLKWYELIPIFSFLALRGKCSECKTKLSPQYPLIEGINGLLWIIVCYFRPVSIGELLSSITAYESMSQFIIVNFLLLIIFCLASSALLTIAIIDLRTLEIPPSLNIFILVLGALRLILDLQNWHVYAIGAVSVSGVLLILWFLTGGRAMGGGDIKLMAVCGLLIGWKLIIIAFLLGCVIGSIIHVIRMSLKNADRFLAFGPYLALGVFISMLWGSQILEVYLGLLSW